MGGVAACAKWRVWQSIYLVYGFGGSVYTKYIPNPQIRAMVYTHFWACSWGAPRAPQRCCLGGTRANLAAGVRSKVDTVMCMKLCC